MHTSSSHPVPSLLDEPYPLAAAEVTRFAEQGVCHLRDVFTADLLARYAPAITDLTLRLDPNRHVPLAERDTYGKAFIQVVNLWLKSHRVREFVFGRRLARLAAHLLGVSSVRLWHDQALYKEPGGGPTPWHADQYYWPMASDRVVTAWIPLQETLLPMGPLGFAAGSHRVATGRDLPIGDRSEEAIGRAVDAGKLPVVREPYRLGDVSFHLGWTFHRAEPNTTTKPRRAMTVIYMDGGMRLAAPGNPNQEIDWMAFCPDVQPGEVIDSPMTPLLWEEPE